MIKLDLNGKWVLTDKINTFYATVPGDINYDMFENLKMPNYFVDSNYKFYNFAENNYTYSKDFDVTREMLKNTCANIIFKGIDCFSKVYVNDYLVGETDNAFIEYTFDIKNYLIDGKNTIKVLMLSTLERYNKNQNDKYKVLFGNNRLNVRTIQCHFGWDWAPKLVSYGIYKDVYITFDDGKRIDSISYTTKNDGSIRIFTNLFNTNGYNAFENEKLLYEISFNNETILSVRSSVKEIKNFINLFIDDCKLWWPNLYGEQNLYKLTVTLLSGDNIVDKKEVNVGFREIKLVEDSIGQDKISFYFMVNGIAIYGKGSNFVPLDVFTGRISSDKYDKAIFLAKEANMNMLRVWGGGMYETEAFYNACDKYGILVWQDAMISCSEIPNDDDYFKESVLKEFEQNVKRIRNHPSILCFTGGNERIKGESTINGYVSPIEEYYLRGISNALAPDIPYLNQSPISYQTLDNDLSSGDCHKSVYDCITEDNIFDIREMLSVYDTNFNSECTSLGPTTKRSYKKMFSDYNPLHNREMWIDRHSRNPYAKVDIPFFDKITNFSKKVYGDIRGIDDFVIKGMDIHSKVFGLQIDYYRSLKRNKGIMNWMFNDIWPTGNWSLIDYYLDRKSAYYTAKRSFEPVKPIYSLKDDVTKLVVSNNKNEEIKARLVYGERSYSGNDIWIKEKNNLILAPLSLMEIDELEKKVVEGNYYFAELLIGNDAINVTYTPNLWDVPSIKPSYTYSIEKSVKEEGNIITPIIFKTKTYVKSLYVQYDSDEFVYYSDNYFDLEANKEKTIFITSKKQLDLKKIEIASFKEAIEL